MPAAVKAPAAKKVAAKRGAPPVPAKKTGAETKNDAQMAKQIKQMRESTPKSTWAEISEHFGIGQGQAMLLYMNANLSPSERIQITGNPKQDNAAVVKARNSGLSWGQVMARTGLNESQLRRMYEEATGTSTLGNRIGRGGRWPAGQGPEPVNDATKTVAKKVAATKKAAAPVAKAAQAAADARKPLADMSLKELQDRLNGVTITVRRGEGIKDERIKVGKVTSVKDGDIRLQDQNGSTRTVLAVHIKAASQKR